MVEVDLRQQKSLDSQPRSAPKVEEDRTIIVGSVLDRQTETRSGWEIRGQQETRSIRNDPVREKPVKRDHGGYLSIGDLNVVGTGLG